MHIQLLHLSQPYIQKHSIVCRNNIQQNRLVCTPSNPFKQWNPSLLFKQPIAHFDHPIRQRIAYNDSKVIIVEDNQLEDVQELIRKVFWVPWIRHVTDSGIWLERLSGSRESCIPTYGECQIMAITIILGKSNLSSASGRDNERFFEKLTYF